MDTITLRLCADGRYWFVWKVVGTGRGGDTLLRQKIDGVGRGYSDKTMSIRYRSVMTGARPCERAKNRRGNRSHTGKWFLRASRHRWLNPTISVARHDLHRYNTHMDFRTTFSKPLKRLKDKLPGGSRKHDGGSESEDSRKGRWSDFKGGEASQSNLYQHSEVSVEGAVESGPSREGSSVGGEKTALQAVDLDPSTSAPSILHIGEPDSM